MSKDRWLFSIIIPTFNRPNQLFECLKALLSQSCPKAEFEIIVVDDGSYRENAAAIASFCRNNDIMLLIQKNGGPASARNYGAKHAGGKFIVFTDDDCLPDKQWLNHLKSHFSRHPDSMVGGKTINYLKGNPFSVTSQAIIDVSYAFYNSSAQNAQFIASNNMALPSRLFHETGGFHADFRTSEDREFCSRWIASGHKLFYLPDAIIHHAHALHFFSFARQHFSYGKGAYRYGKIRTEKKRKSTCHFLKFHLVLWSLLRIPLRKTGAIMTFNVIVLMIFWEIVNTAGFFYEFIASKNKRTKGPIPSFYSVNHSPFKESG